MNTATHIVITPNIKENVRLYLMCFDILERQEIVTYRENEHDFLMSIREGRFGLDRDGQPNEDFFDLISSYECRLEYAKKNTSLPKAPDMKKVEDLVYEVTRQVLGL